MLNQIRSSLGTAVRTVTGLAALLMLPALLASVSTAFALNPKRSIAQYGHSIWIRENGLPANSVNVVLQTKDGYLWLGTSEGLFRFDGRSFERVRMNPKEGSAPESITALCQTRNGALWIGTEYKGLRMLRKGKVNLFGAENGFSNTQVWKIIQTRDGRLLVASSIGLFIFKHNEFQLVGNPDYTTALAEDSSGRIWIGTYAGVAVYNNGLSRKLFAINSSSGLLNSNITCITADREGTVWIGTTWGMARWRRGHVTEFTAPGGPGGLPGNHINAVFEDRDGNIWVGTNGGLARLADGKWSDYTARDGLTDNDVTGFEEDQEGSLWICTSNGLNQFKDVSVTTFTTYDSLASNSVSGIVETPDHSFYFLSADGASITRFLNGRRSVYSTSVGPACVGRDGTLWIAQNGTLANIRNGKLVHYGQANGIPMKWISAVTADREGPVFYSDHVGLFRFVHGKAAPYMLAGGKRFPADEFVTCLDQEGDSVLWAGTPDGLFEIKNDRLKKYDAKDGLSANWVSCVYESRDGTVWIGSTQGGITRFRNGKFTVFDSESGLFSNTIYSILGDDMGGLWMSSPSGIGYVSLRQLNDYSAGHLKKIQCRVFGTAEGMKIDECIGYWQPAAWKDLNGRLWFPTRGGAVMIVPGSFRVNPLPPPVHIEDVTADGSMVPPDTSTVLKAGTSRIEFRYAALSFRDPSRVDFRYRLEGYDHEWIDAGNRRTTFYTNLPPGSYTFRVIACNNDGVWNESGASFSFVIRPHFYQTAWFTILLLLAAGGAAFGLYRLRVWQLLDKEKKLNARIQEAMASIKVLGGLIPICSNCKKIRGDKGYWEHLEKYIQTHSEAQFSHSICPDCVEKLYPELGKRSGKREGEE